MKCPHCSTEMKALFTSTYCPNDCDRSPPTTLRMDEIVDEGLTYVQKKLFAALGRKDPPFLRVKASEIDWSRLYAPYVPLQISYALFDEPGIYAEVPKGNPGAIFWFGDEDE